MTVDLRVDWCSYEAAKYAVEHWHYSRSMPTPPSVYIGVWEFQSFIGCVIFGRGSNNNGHKPYGIKMTEFCELTRIALRNHETPVSKVVSTALRMLKSKSPGVRLVVSYADPNHDHVGAIYQAGNWVYTGQTGADFEAIDQTGRKWHSRQVSISTQNAPLFRYSVSIAISIHSTVPCASRSNRCANHTRNARYAAQVSKVTRRPKRRAVFDPPGPLLT